jgi:gliding motility-associated-like protein
VYVNVCTDKALQSIIVDENVTANAGSDQEMEYVFETKMDAGLSQYGTGEWSLVSGSGNINDINSPTTIITELSVGENIFLWKVQNGSCEATDEVVIAVKDIITQTVITPNEDGLNDVLIFPGLIAFPGSTIIIYNRWGSEVYRNADYKNDWNGKDNKNRDLQEDTYYYVLRISNGRILKGFIEIKR